MDYRFYSIQVRHASCATVRRVIRGYFRGDGHALGDVPTDGYRVYGWWYLINDLHAYGTSGNARFSARYR